MRNETVTIQINNFQTLMTSLANHFYSVSDLITGQIKAVVNNDFEELNALIEKQIDENGIISNFESAFKKELIQHFSALDVTPTSYSLTALLPYICTVDGNRLIELRNRLKEAVQNTQKKQAHLIQLLDFAQKHLAETLREIFNLSEQHNTHYKSTGQKSTGHNQSRIINQTI